MDKNTLIEMELDYLERMADCRPFNMFNIDPVWKPGQHDIVGFCHDEVVRQYHDTNIEDDGGKRVRWMYDAWKWARRISEVQEDAGDPVLPTLQDVLRLGYMIEPETNSTEHFRKVNVSIGGDVRSHYSDVPHEMAELWQDIINVVPVQGKGEFGSNKPSADDFYLAFEYIHPFADGNGRTGKIIHNWLLGTLDNPVLVADYFGGGNP